MHHYLGPSTAHKMMFSCVCFVYIIDNNKKVTKQSFGFYKYQNELGMFNFCPFLWLPPSIGRPTSFFMLMHAFNTAAVTVHCTEMNFLL